MPRCDVVEPYTNEENHALHALVRVFFTQISSYDSAERVGALVALEAARVLIAAKGEEFASSFAREIASRGGLLGLEGPQARPGQEAEMASRTRIAVAR